MVLNRFSNERHQLIMDRLMAEGQVSVKELADTLAVTQETIRRDLTKLEQDKYLKKIHGGAVNIQSKFERELTTRIQLAATEKEAIAAAALKLIHPGDTLFVDFGSTTLAFAQQLKRIDRLTVITNSPMIAKVLHENNTIECILLGGQFYHSEYACLGAITLQCLRSFYADYAIIGVGAFDLDKGVMDADINEAAIAQNMVAHSHKTIALADSTKLNKQVLNLVAPWRDIDVLVTCGIKIPQDSIIVTAGVSVIQAPLVFNAP